MKFTMGLSGNAKCGINRQPLLTFYTNNYQDWKIPISGNSAYFINLLFSSISPGF